MNTFLFSSVIAVVAFAAFTEARFGSGGGREIEKNYCRLVREITFSVHMVVSDKSMVILFLRLRW